MRDKVAFISGGGSGIGQAAAELLARRGFRVALAGRTPDELAEVAEAIGRAGGTALAVTCDVERRGLRSFRDRHHGGDVGTA